MAETDTPIAPATGEIDPAIMEAGKQSYLLCSACHGAEGQGMPQVGPPFQNSEWVTGPVENLIRIQLRGLTGPITVNGIEYNPAVGMGALAMQTDDQIAAVLTYIRNSFGNKASAVTPDMVTALRSEVGKPQLTVSDLLPPIAEAATQELATAVEAEIPKAEGYVTFPLLIPTLIFLLVVAAGTAKLLMGGSKG